MGVPGFYRYKQRSCEEDQLSTPLSSLTTPTVVSLLMLVYSFFSCGLTKNDYLYDILEDGWWRTSPRSINPAKNATLIRWKNSCSKRTSILLSPTPTAPNLITCIWTSMELFINAAIPKIG